MQKNVIIAIVVILVVGGAAAFFFQGKNKARTETAEKNANVITSIHDALSKSISLECVYTNAKVGDSKTYIKNGVIRSDYMGGQVGQSGSVIVTDKKMYVWTADKKGFMMSFSQTEASPKTMQEKENTRTQKEQFLSDLELYKDNCKPAVVADSLFVPPSDIKFVDYSQMIEQSQSESGDSMKNN